MQLSGSPSRQSSSLDSHKCSPTVAQFIDYLKTRPRLWDNGSGRFCDWATKYIYKATSYGVPSNWPKIRPRTSLVDRLRQCVPSNTKSAIETGKEMPLLESTQNGMKASAFSNKELRRESAFRNYSFAKKVFIMRSVVGIADYLQFDDVRKQFVDGSQCIKDVWAAWQVSYRADSDASGIPRRSLENVPTLYQAWIRRVVAQVPENLEEALTDMIDR
ncbi:hypothetical protein GGX14DRAFT_571955 [Mycena pura]|uniref:Uncharacterized protein n=1 Tax=Mycena pura TaxID=153505 RepID=A0AAD6V1S1_9AGAR|nr:hypothetical protein GGX14DRAFT_571955 [Mycena pura]